MSMLHLNPLRPSPLVMEFHTFSLTSHLRRDELQAAARQAEAQAEASGAAVRLKNVVAGEENAITSELKKNREVAAQEWDSKYATLESRLDEIDANFQTFTSCVKDGKWTC